MVALNTGGKIIKLIFERDVFMFLDCKRKRKFQGIAKNYTFQAEKGNHNYSPIEFLET